MKITEILGIRLLPTDLCVSVAIKAVTILDKKICIDDLAVSMPMIWPGLVPEEASVVMRGRDVERFTVYAEKLSMGHFAAYIENQGVIISVPVVEIKKEAAKES